MLTECPPDDRTTTPMTMAENSKDDVARLIEAADDQRPDQDANDEDISYDDDEGPAGVEWQQLPPEREFFASPYDPPVKALVQEMRDGELIVRPTFQRYSVWDATRKSRFVESVLLNIPIPMLFFAEDDDKSKVVVDGQQRLSALKEYLDNRFPLKGLEVLSQLNGKSFDELTDRQKRIIRNRAIRCLVISANSDSEIRFQVFERLNQGGVVLNAQEVRHCVLRGGLNDLLHKLTEETEWQQLFGLKSVHHRMNDCELILRFLALRSVLPAYSPPLKSLLNEFMRLNRNPSSEELAQLRGAFESAGRAVRTAFHGVALRRVFRSKTEKGFAIDRTLNRAVFDAEMLVMEGMNLNWIGEHRAEILRAFIGLCLDDEKFADSVSRATADKTRLIYRVSTWKQALIGLGAELPAASRLP